MSQIQRKTTIQTSNVIAEDMVDKVLRERYGTSIDEYMSKEYQKQLQAKIRKLREEFFEINKDKNSYISLDELCDFFNRKNNGQYSREYFEKVFRVLDKNKDQRITVGEFIESYIYLEEKLKIRRVKIDKVIEELNVILEKDKGNLDKAGTEKQLGNGLTDKSTLYVTIIEARNLVPSGLVGSCDPFVVLTFGDTVEKSNFKKSTNCPAWNERFHFPVTNQDTSLKVEVYDQSMMGSKLLGYATIDLNSMNDQKKISRWFKLLLNGKEGENGEIYMRLQYIYSLKRYYEDKIQETQRNIQIVQSALPYIDTVLQKVEEPFGIIIAGEIDNLLNNNNLEKVDKLIDEFEKNREVAFAKRNEDIERPYTEKVGQIIRETFGQKNVPWSALTTIMMGIYVTLSAISILERTDFVNLFISVSIWLLFLYDKKNDVLKYLLTLIICIGISIAYDLVWIFLQYSPFWKGNDDDLEIGLKRVIYVIGFLIIIVKGFLIYSLNGLRTKKERANSGELTSYSKNYV